MNAMKRLLLFALLLVPSVAQAAPEKWWDAYARGVNAVNAKSYSTAVEALQKSIREMPNEGVNVRAGNSLITYVPHFWLGIARFNLGDVEGALRAWSTSEQQGVISRTEYYAGMKDWIARAQLEKVRKAESAVKGPRSQADSAINGAIKAQVEAVKDGADRAETYRAAQRKLQEALGQFNKAGTNADAYKTAEAMAGQARALFLKAAEEGKAIRLARANAAKAQPKPQPVPVQRAAIVAAKPVEIAPPVVETKPAAETKPSPQKAAPPPVVVPQQQQPADIEPAVESEASVAARVSLQKYRSAVSKIARDDRSNAAIQTFIRNEAKEVDWLRQRVDRARGNNSELTQIARELDQRERALFERVTELRAAAAATAALSQPVSEPREARAGLQTAYRAFAAGDLDTSEQLLTKIVTEAPSAEAFLLRGCARYTRAMLSRTPETLLADATGDFRAALARNPKLRLDGRAFSPKLIAYFEQVRTAR